MTGASPDGTVSAPALLGGALERLRANPGVVAAFLLAGTVVAGVDLLRLRSPVPALSYAEVHGDVTLGFWVLVTVVSRTELPLSALIDLKLSWLAVTVGLELFALVTVVGTSCYGLAQFLDVDLSWGALLRYGGLLALLQFGSPSANFSGGAVLVGLVLLAALVFVFVRLVPLPGRLVLGEPLRTALGRSWAQTHGYGWSLLGVVLVLGLVNHGLTLLPVVGPVGSAAVAAVHAGVVAAFLRRTGGATATEAGADHTASAVGSVG